jgi:hypothetical protein
MAMPSTFRVARKVLFRQQLPTQPPVRLFRSALDVPFTWYIQMMCGTGDREMVISRLTRILVAISFGILEPCEHPTEDGNLGSAADKSGLESHNSNHDGRLLSV